MQTCRTCDAPIIWAIWPKTGERAPFDAEPVRNGNVILEGKPLRARYVEPSPERSAYRSHFATCPDAAAHRKLRVVDEPLPKLTRPRVAVKLRRRLPGLCFYCGRPTGRRDVCQADEDLVEDYGQ